MKYEIIPTVTVKDEDKFLVNFITYIDGEEHALKVEYTSQVKDELKSNHNLDVQVELENILKEEMRLEISRYLGGEYWKEKSD